MAIINKLLFVLSVSGILLCTVSAPILSAATDTLDRSHPAVITVKNGTLTASAREVPLHVLLKEIADQTGIGFEMFGQADRTITVELKAVPLNNGIKRILKGNNSTIIYTDHSSLASAAIHKIIVLDQYGGSSGPPTQSQISRIPPPTKITTAGSRQQKQRRLQTTTRKWPQESAERISIEAYGEQLSSEDWEQRREAVFNITDDYPDDALPHLEQALLNDGNEEVRALAAEKIGDLGNEDGVDALAKGIHDPDIEVREAVISALREIGSTEALPALQQALQGSNTEIRDAAAELIAEINTQIPGTVDEVFANETFVAQKTIGQTGGRKPKKGER